MTDEKIEKGLECCGSYKCDICPYEGVSRCSDELCKDALAYINRLKAEKAVSDRALKDLACDDAAEFGYAGDEDAINAHISLYVDEAKQELEKEKGNVENQG